MKYIFVLASGFGMDNRYWQNLLPFLASYPVYDLNDKPSIPTDGYLIGIGHSYGFIKLLRSRIQFDQLIGLHGFIDFLDQNNRKRHAEWRAFRNAMKMNLYTTLQHFYHRIGVDFAPLQTNCLLDGFHFEGNHFAEQNHCFEQTERSSKIQKIDPFDRENCFSHEETSPRENILHQALDHLIVPVSAPSCRTLILGTKNDVITPPNLLENNFRGSPQVSLHILNQGQHALGYLYAAEVAVQIEQVIS